MAQSKRPMIALAVAGALVVLAVVVMLALRGGGEGGVASSPADKAGLAAPAESGPEVEATRPAAVDAAPGATSGDDAAGMSSSATVAEAEASAPGDDVLRGPLWRGSVVSAESGAPIEGARLSVLENNQSVAVAALPQVAFRAESGADGEFVVRAQPARALGEMERLRVEADGHASLIHILPRARSDADRRVVLRLAPGDSISGVVTGGAMSPVAGALVGFLVLEDFSPMEMMRGTAKTVVSSYALSDEQGAFTLAGVRAGESYRLPVRAEGFLAQRTGDIMAGTRDVRIVLERGSAAIEGLVLDAEGEPFAGAYATLTGSGAQRMAMVGSVMDSLMSTSEARSDAQGRFAFRGLAAGAHDLVVTGGNRPPGMMTTGSVVNKPVTLGEGETQQVEIRFEAPVTITGRAIEKATGEGVAGLRIGTEPYAAFPMMGGITPPDTGAPREGEVVTGPDGAFELSVPIMDAGMMRLAMYYYDPPDGWVALPGSNPMTQGAPGMGMVMAPSPGSRQEAVIELVRGVRRSGIVQQPDGSTPAAHATIQLSQRTGPAGSGSSDGEGRFFFDGQPGTEATMAVEHESGFGSGEIAFDEALAGEEIVVVLEPAGSISGNVVDSSGRPVAGAEVFFEAARGLGNLFAMPTLDSFVATRTDDEGYFFREGLKPGRYQLRAAPPDRSGLAEGRSERITLEPGQDARDVEIVLEGGTFLDGVALDARTGEPVPGVQVMAMMGGDARMPEMTETDAEGYFALEGIGEGQRVQMMMFTKQGYDMEMREGVGQADAPLTVELQPQLSLEIEAFHVGSGEPVARYAVRVEAVAGGFNPMDFAGGAGGNRVIEDARGRGTIDGVGAGQQKIIVAELDGDTPTGGQGSVTVDMDEMQDGDLVRVPVQPGRAVQGRVVMASSGQGVEGAEVRLAARGMIQLPPMFQMGNDAFAIPPVTSAADGSFEFRQVAPGDFEASATIEGHFTKGGSVVVSIPEEGDNPFIVLDLEPGGSVTGTVTGHDGLPGAGLTVDITSHQGLQGGSATTDDAGRYRIELMPPGRAGAMLQSGAEMLETKPVEVLAGQEVVLDFDLSGRIRVTGRIVTQPGAEMLAFGMTLQGDSGPQSLNWNGATYGASLPPGTYTVISGMMNMAPAGPTITVAPEPREQVIDITLPHLPVRVRLQGPDGTTPTRGFAELRAEDGSTARVMAGMGGPGLGGADLYLGPGTYTATFESHDGAWVGGSEATTIAPGAANELVLLVAPATE